MPTLGLRRILIFIGFTMVFGAMLAIGSHHHVEQTATATMQSGLTWLDPNWIYRQKITIPLGNVNSALTDFPVYVDLGGFGDAFFDFVNATGADIRITTADGITELPREIVSLDTTNQTGELHFKAGTLLDIADTEFYIYYGNPAAAEPAESAPNGREAVWTNGFAAVFHLEETGSSFSDASPNANTGSKSGAPHGVPGKLGISQDFDGSDYINIPSNATIILLNSWTYSFWLNVDSFDSYNYIMGKGYPTAPTNFAFWIMEMKPAGELFYNSLNTGMTLNLQGFFGPRSAFGTGEWVYVTMGYESATNSRIGSINGFEDTTTYYNNGPPQDYGQPLKLGVGFTNRNGLKGKLDEFRASNVLRSTDWIATEFHNQNSPSTFYTLGFAELFNTPSDDACHHHP